MTSSTSTSRSSGLQTTTRPARSSSKPNPPNAYAPWIPSPLNPNPKEHCFSPARASRRIVRRVSKPVTTSSTPQSSSTTTSSSSPPQQQYQTRRPPRPVTATQRLLRRKAEEAMRVHNLYRHIQEGAPKQHRASSYAQHVQRTGGGGKGGKGAEVVPLVHITGNGKKPPPPTRERDEWALDMVNGHGAEEVDLDLLERKLGIGWQGGSEDVVGVEAEARQQAEVSRRRLQRFKMAGVLRRPTRGVLLAVALVCLCGLPALRGQAMLRRIGAFAIGV